MNNPKINYAIEVTMLVCVLSMATTSIIMWIKDKTGSFAGNTIITIHHTVGTIFLVLLAAHIIMHLRILLIMTKNYFKKKPKIKEEQVQKKEDKQEKEKNGA